MASLIVSRGPFSSKFKLISSNLLWYGCFTAQRWILKPNRHSGRIRKIQFDATLRPCGLRLTPPHTHMSGSRLTSRSTKSAYIISKDFDSQLNIVTVVWDDLSSNQYPLEFLRDNCRCAQCWQASSGHRLVAIQAAVEAAENLNDIVIVVENDGTELMIKWGDGHKSYFEASWLTNYRFPAAGETVAARTNTVKEGGKTLWSSKLNGYIPSMDFQDVLVSDRHIYNWMELLASHGLCLLKDSPMQPNQITKLGEKAVGFLRQTCYGDIFTVRSKPNASNVAYTVEDLPLHTDQPYYYYQPGIQILHCIKQSPGTEGVNHLVDGFKVAEDLKNRDRKSFDLLTSVQFLFKDTGTDAYGDYHLESEMPIIGLDKNNEVTSIRHNNPVRDRPLNVDVRTLRDVYRAYNEFVKLMYDPRNLVQYKMEEGDMLCFNNQRVLHGRTAFDPQKADRWLEGAYLDWDDLYSKMRVLKKKINNDTQDCKRLH